jgi:acyl-CoA thioester hydrolase
MSVHRLRFRVRYGETDQMGYVHHSVYLLYFEEGRTGLMRDLGCSYAELERKGQILPVSETALRFRTPARYDEELVTETTVTSVSGARVRFDYRVLHAADGTVAAEGHTVLASCGSDGRPRRLPAELDALFRGAAGDPGASFPSSKVGTLPPGETP